MGRARAHSERPMEKGPGANARMHHRQDDEAWRGRSWPGARWSVRSPTGRGVGGRTDAPWAMGRRMRYGGASKGRERATGRWVGAAWVREQGRKHARTTGINNGAPGGGHGRELTRSAPGAHQASREGARRKHDQFCPNDCPGETK